MIIIKATISHSFFNNIVYCSLLLSDRNVIIEILNNKITQLLTHTHSKYLFEAIFYTLHISFFRLNAHPLC